MEKIVDARGLNCPQPVILTKRAMDENDGSYKITTIVNQKVALENVSKLAVSQGYEYEVEEKGGDFYIHMYKMTTASVESKEKKEIAILIKSRLFGEGEEELGQILMKSFLYTLMEMKGDIKHIIFMNSGVFLACEGSPVLEHLKVMEEEGVNILSCGTCLDYYQMKDKLKVGSVTNMYTAVEILTSAHKSLTL
ncbi:sulfurtransferase-like selenium metabolism protein YedF [Thermosyntropha sp.]|uniref:sulfurtransferase-like selenium metabolism protein YedF n=1 Tax=Thermosyntropha sp. TaxID=2740820 RepID=UPI0025E4CBBF|nr:sulfurtransferase-like selenium metabolism protein YedF [Thermosyntropha sp.]MBO8158190.1 sulfurtransferase-like selenium metabolism protein YedF [Thermosyntropha sp.]